MFESLFLSVNSGTRNYFHHAPLNKKQYSCFSHTNKVEYVHLINPDVCNI